MNALEENRHNIESNLAAIDAATATVITKTAGMLNKYLLIISLKSFSYKLNK